MNRGARSGLVVILAALPLTSLAHRLDEYLQATRLALAADRIVLKMDLTPGVDVASIILASIDTVRDGRITADEASAYANRVLQDIALEVDGKRRPLDLVSREFPSLQEMRAGLGVIRIEALAPWPATPGPHALWYKNNHQPELGAYLVNALVPENRKIEITAQHRDTLQREFRLEFDIR